MAAWKVSVGAVPPGGVAAAKRAAQVVEVHAVGVGVDAGGEDVGEGVDLGVGKDHAGGGGDGLAGGGVGEIGGGTEDVGEAGEIGGGDADVGGSGGERGEGRERVGGGDGGDLRDVDVGGRSEAAAGREERGLGEVLIDAGAGIASGGEEVGDG